MKRRIYLSGGMSGVERAVYVRRFGEAEAILRRHGYGCITPCRVWACRWPWIYRAMEWVLEQTMKESPNRQLYEQWAEAGWLHVCPGEVFDSAYAINRIAQLVEKGINIYVFCYDPAQSITPINNLKAWLQTLFQKRPDLSTKDIADMIKRMVIPVSQGAMTQNPRIGELEEKMLGQEEWMQFSDNPLWPWTFGNCAIETGSSELRRIIKGGPQPTHKIDPVHALLDALYGFDLCEGKIEQ